MRQLLFLFLFLIVSSCKKDKISLEVTEIPSHTNMDLRSISNDGSDNIYITGGNDDHGIILKSEDAGISFSIFNSDFNQRINDLVWLDSNNVFIVGNDFKAFHSNDQGGTWQPVWFNGFISLEYLTDLLKITALNDSTLFFCGGWQFGKGVIGKSVDKGISWSYTPLDHEMRSIKFFDDSHGICVGYGALLFTNNGGIDWHFSDAKNQFWTSLVINQNIALACSYTGAIAQSEDMGITWHILRNANTLLQNSGHFNSIHTIDGINLYCAGFSGDFIYSENTGSDWKSVTSFASNSINDVLLIKDKEGLCVGDEGKIFHFH